MVNAALYSIMLFFLYSEFRSASIVDTTDSESDDNRPASNTSPTNQATKLKSSGKTSKHCLVSVFHNFVVVLTK